MKATKKKQMKTPKDKFTIIITEKDRQLAGHFASNCICLVATALKRRGYKKVCELVDQVVIGQHLFTHSYLGSHELHCDSKTAKKPFYGPEVVGLKITFVKQD